MLVCIENIRQLCSCPTKCSFPKNSPRFLAQCRQRCTTKACVNFR